MKKSTMISLGFLFLITNSAVIAETPSHEHGTHIMTPEMKKQHQTMVIINRYWNSCAKAIQAKDLKAVNVLVDKILKLAPEVKSFKLHRNADKHELLLEKQNDFEEQLKKLKEAVAGKNIDASKESAKAVQKTCNNCHALFK